MRRRGKTRVVGAVLPLRREDLHDARLIEVSYVAGEDEPQSVTATRVQLKGPYFDRVFELNYVAVREATVTLRDPAADLLIHELRREGEHLVHELVFDGGGSITVVCARVIFAEHIGALG